MTTYGRDVAQSAGDILSGLLEREGPPQVVDDLIRALDMDEGFLGQQLPEGYAWDKTQAHRGYNLRNLANAKIRDPSAVAKRIAAEALKDERISAATGSATMSSNGVLSITVRIVLATGIEFAFTIQIGDMTVEYFYNGRPV